jgi:hypothetical protein
MRFILRYVAAFVLVTAPALPVLAQPAPFIVDWCYDLDHFPDQPIGDAPSKITIFSTVPTEFAGGTFTFLFTGPSGNQMGFGPIDERGLATAPAPLYQYKDTDRPRRVGRHLRRR